eukprot:2585366-Amphidinium_carterae.1
MSTCILTVRPNAPQHIGPKSGTEIKTTSHGCKDLKGPGPRQKRKQSDVAELVWEVWDMVLGERGLCQALSSRTSPPASRCITPGFREGLCSFRRGQEQAITVSIVRLFRSLLQIVTVTAKFMTDLHSRADRLKAIFAVLIVTPTWLVCRPRYCEFF